MQVINQIFVTIMSLLNHRYVTVMGLLHQSVIFWPAVSVPVKKMHQLFGDVDTKPLGDLELVAIMLMVSDNYTVEYQEDNC